MGQFDGQSLGGAEVAAASRVGDGAASAGRALRLRLVHVHVQPVLMLDDGETLTPLEHPAVTIPAADWPTYSSERFPREIAEWQSRLDAEAQAREENDEGGTG